ncbi:hypothetical protein PANA5342_pPANA10192 (plasmid) [Pantoea ananatis LMG 5342]|nr:hypothetical protein PANA5342_pPANA10192 [Pantoea ananatis LMG 5342]
MNLVVHLLSAKVCVTVLPFETCSGRPGAVRDTYFF